MWMRRMLFLKNRKSSVVDRDAPSQIFVYFSRDLVGGLDHRDDFVDWKDNYVQT